MEKTKKIAKILAAIAAILIITLIILKNPQKPENIVTLQTNLGEIKIQLYTKESPITTENFKKLVKNGFYDATKFHRIIPNFMIQGGDPLSKDNSKKDLWGTGGPGYTIEDEFIEGLSNIRGTISMANTGQPNSGSSQFFINVADNTFLDWDKEPQTSKHPAFGKIIQGMEIVDQIANTQTDTNDRPITDITIISAKIE